MGVQRKEQLENGKDFPREMEFEHQRRSGTIFGGRLCVIHLGKTT